MSMDYTLTGEFDLYPPLNHKDLLKVDAYRWGYKDNQKIEDAIVLDIRIENVETDEGTLTKRSCSRVRPRDEGDWGFHAALEFLAKLDPERLFEGYVTSVCEEVYVDDSGRLQGVTRLEVHKGKLIHHVPSTLRWEAEK